MSWPARRAPFYQAWILPNGDKDYLTVFVRVSAGRTIPAHVHTKAWHQTCVVTGAAYSWVEGDARRIDSGQCFTVPAGTHHAIRAGQDGGHVDGGTTGPIGGYPPLEAV